MSNHDLEIFTDEQLIKLAGKAAFTRGKNYHLEDRVISLQINNGNITACVEGNYNYEVHLTHRKNRLEGGCECPASEGFDFCKHCVATAMAYRKVLLEQNELKNGDSTQRIEAYLNTLHQEELVNHLLRLITSDSSQEYQWSIKADIALNKFDENEIKKRITKAIPYNRHYYRYNQVQGFFNQIDPIVELLESQLENLHPEKALKLVDYALQRLDKALETIDDSGGYRFDIIAPLIDMHRNSLLRTNWSTKKLVNYLVKLNSLPYTELYPDIPYCFEDILQKEGMDLIFACFQDEWDKLPNLSIKQNRDDLTIYYRLEYILSERAKENNDWQELINILKKTAITQHEILNLFNICMDNNDLSQAEFWLQKAKKSDNEFPNSNSRKTQQAEVKLLSKKSEYAKAVELQFEIFIESLQLDDYKSLISLASQAGKEKEYRANTVLYLQSKLDEQQSFLFGRNHTDTLAKIYLYEKKFYEALELAKKHHTTDSVSLSIARSFLDKPNIAIPLFQQLADHNIQRGNNSSYRYAIELLLECYTVLKNQDHNQLFEDTLNTLLQKYKAKRNFVKFAKEAFKID